MKKIFLLLIVLLCGSISYAAPGLEEGVKAPVFTAENYDGSLIALSDLTNTGPVVLIFYRGGWCPYCNLQLKEYQSHLEGFKEAGATIVAVSVDNPQMALKTAETQELGFYVVSDPDAELLESYGVVYTVPEETSKMYAEKYDIDLQAHSGRGDGVIAVPATYVIDADGTVVYAYANEDYKVRPKAQDVLKVVEDL